MTGHRYSHHASRVFNGLGVGDAIVRQASTTDEAVLRGGGYLYFKRSNGRPVGPAGARELIDGQALKPLADGLFEGASQCFEKTRETLVEAIESHA